MRSILGLTILSVLVMGSMGSLAGDYRQPELGFTKFLGFGVATHMQSRLEELQDLVVPKPGISDKAYIYAWPAVPDVERFYLIKNLKEILAEIDQLINNPPPSGRRLLADAEKKPLTNAQKKKIIHSMTGEAHKDMFASAILKAIKRKKNQEKKAADKPAATAEFAEESLTISHQQTDPAVYTIKFGQLTPNEQDQLEARIKAIRAERRQAAIERAELIPTLSPPELEAFYAQEAQEAAAAQAERDETTELLRQLSPTEKDFYWRDLTAQQRIDWIANEAIEKQQLKLAFRLARGVYSSFYLTTEQNEALQIVFPLETTPAE